MGVRRCDLLVPGFEPGLFGKVALLFAAVFEDAFENVDGKVVEFVLAFYPQLGKAFRPRWSSE